MATTDGPFICANEGYAAESLWCRSMPEMTDSMARMPMAVAFMRLRGCGEWDIGARIACETWGCMCWEDRDPAEQVVCQGERRPPATAILFESLMHEQQV